MPVIINGSRAELPTDPRVSLRDLLREHLHLPGTKKGCNQGACGACTVLVDGERILSCLALAVQYEGRSITTLEGLTSDGALHPLQHAFVERDGFQCDHASRFLGPRGGRCKAAPQAVAGNLLRIDPGGLPRRFSRKMNEPPVGASQERSPTVAVRTTQAQAGIRGANDHLIRKLGRRAARMAPFEHTRAIDANNSLEKCETIAGKASNGG